MASGFSRCHICKYPIVLMLTLVLRYGSAFNLPAAALISFFDKIYAIHSTKLTLLATLFIFKVDSLLSTVAPTSIAFIIGRTLSLSSASTNSVSTSTPLLSDSLSHLASSSSAPHSSSSDPGIFTRISTLSTAGARTTAPSSSNQSSLTKSPSLKQ